jgi:integrase
MSKKGKTRPDLSDMTPSPAALAALDEKIEQMDMQRVFVVGARNAMAKALGLPERYNGPQSDKRSDETVEWLLSVYRTDPRSPLLKLPLATRTHYDGMLRRLDQIAGRKLSDLNEPDIQQLFEQWTAAAAASGKGTGTATAKGAIAILRAAVNFAATTLKNSECFRLAVLLRDMKFATAEKRKVVPLTEDDVKRIMAKSKEMGWPSIGLAQLLQYECKLGQRDVIGEWVPPAELRETSAIINGDQAWHRGIRWSNISEDWVLTHKTRNSGKVVRINLRSRPLVFAELSSRPTNFGSSNPLILKDGGKFPWIPWDFRRMWREIARAANISDDKFSTDIGAPEQSRAQQAS